MFSCLKRSHYNMKSLAGPNEPPQTSRVKLPKPSHAIKIKNMCGVLGNRSKVGNIDTSAQTHYKNNMCQCFRYFSDFLLLFTFCAGITCSFFALARWGKRKRE